jgi:Trypsin-co-occurring domain 2
VEITDTGVDIAGLVSTIKNSIKKANVSGTDAASDLRVVSIDLVLNTVATEKAGGGVELRVPFVGMKLKFGANVTRKDTHTIEMTLIPPDLDDRPQLRSFDIEESLVTAIETIRAVVGQAAQGDVPFVLKHGSVEIEFVVTSTGTISLGVEGELSKEVTHTLRLHLGQPTHSQS